MTIEILKKASDERIKIAINSLRNLVKEFYPREFEEFKDKNKAREKIKQIEEMVLKSLNDEEIKNKLGEKDIGELTNEKRVYFFYLGKLHDPNIEDERQIYLYCKTIVDFKGFGSLYKENKNGETAISVINNLFPEKTKIRGVGGFAGTNKKD